MEGLEEKIEDGFSSLHSKIDGALKDHEDRIRVVERIQTEQAGGWKLLTVIGAIAAAVGGVIASAWSSIFGGG